MGLDSVFLFKILGLDVEFLQLPVTKWITYPSYRSNIEIFKGFKVVNDLAKRGVRIAHDFKNYACKGRTLSNRITDCGVLQ